MSDPREPAAVSEHVAQNIGNIAALHASAEQRVGRHQRGIERLAAVIGRPESPYVILVLVGAWVAFNLAAPRWGAGALDVPPFPWLQCVTSVAALLMTSILLTTQNRQSKRSLQREHLDLQVNLVAEQKVAKLIALVEELRRDLPSVPDRHDSMAEAMTEAVDPNAVATVLEETLDAAELPSATAHHGDHSRR